MRILKSFLHIVYLGYNNICNNILSQIKYCNNSGHSQHCTFIIWLLYTISDLTCVVRSSSKRKFVDDRGCVCVDWLGGGGLRRYIASKMLSNWGLSSGKTVNIGESHLCGSEYLNFRIWFYFLITQKLYKCLQYICLIFQWSKLLEILIYSSTCM